MSEVPRPTLGYDAIYDRFDSPLEQRLRAAAYGEDLGQHSWTRAGELADIARHLGLTASSRLLDLGCGPGGALVHLVGRSGCSAVGVDLSSRAIALAHTRARAAGLVERLDLRAADCDQPLPCAPASFSAALAIDVVVHLRDRAATFADVRRLLSPGGRFLFTDAGVVGGVVTAEELERRSVHGAMSFAPVGENERTLAAAGLRVRSVEDRTADLLASARGRLAARAAHRDALQPLESAEAFARTQRYLETVVRLAERGALTRWLYVSERPRS